MASAVAPSLACHLVAAQVGGNGLRDALEAALDACGIPAAAANNALRRLLVEQRDAAAVLAMAANASGHPCAHGILVARLLSSSLVSASELLAAADPSELALAVADLHTCAAGSALPAQTAAASRAAFITLIKLLATSGDVPEQQRAAEQVMAHLRRAWLVPGAAAPHTQNPCVDAALLLAAAVNAVDAEVFPRHLAHSWLATELGHVLRWPAAAEHLPPQQEGVAAGEAGPGSSWADAMAAYAAALPAGALLEQAQAAAWEGRMHPKRTAALLAAAAQQHPPAGPQVEAWAAAQAAAALAKHAPAPMRALVLLQRELLLWRGSGVAGGSTGTLLPPEGAQQQQQSAQQAYKQWFAANLVAPSQHPHLPFLVQQVLIPLVPEESGSCGWLQAQADVLAGLLRLAQQPAAAPLPQAAARAAEEYLEAAGQWLRAEHAAAAAAGGGQAAAGGCPAAPLTNLQKGQALVAALLREYEDCGSELRSGTLNQMLAKASNVFTRGEVHNMLLLALLAPTDDGVEAQRRMALMQYLYHEMGRRGDTQIRPQLKPELLALFHQRCLQAQLEGASLQQLVERAPQLLMAGGPATQGSASGSVSSHHVLDKLGRLVGEELRRWQSQQQQQRPGSGRQESSPLASGPDKLAIMLLDVWTAAYCSSSGGSRSSSSGSISGPSPAAVAAHLLSIAHAHPPLHSSLLHRLQQRLLGSKWERPAAVPVTQNAHQADLEAAVLLATVAGALVQQPGAGSLAGVHATGAGHPETLRPLYMWHQEHGTAPPAAPAPAGTLEAAVTVPGPVWLQQLLLALPLSDAAAMARSAGVAAAHLSCLRHFSQHCLLPDDNGSTSGSGGTAVLALRRQQEAAPETGSYDGEFAARLVFPACTAAVRLLQWLLLRLSVGSQLLPRSQGGGSGAGWGDTGRASKRQRGAAVKCGDAAAECTEVLEACRRALGSEQGCLLATAAGRWPLGDYLRLEAAASGGRGSTDLLPPGAAEATLCLCSTLYLQPGSGSSSELNSWIQPLCAAPPVGGSSSAGTLQDAGDVLTIPDSEEEEELAPAAGNPRSSRSCRLAEALGAAAAAALAGAAQEQAAAEVSAALSVCQRSCAHSLRLLAASPSSPGLPSLLAHLLASAVQRSRQQLAVRAVAPAAQQAAVQLRVIDPQQAERLQQTVSALARGLALDLLPLPLLGSSVFEVQQQQLAAVAEAVQWALSDVGLGAGPAEVQQRLAAALEGP